MGGPAQTGYQVGNTGIDRTNVARLAMTSNVFVPDGGGTGARTVVGDFVYGADRRHVHGADAKGERNCDPPRPDGTHTCFALWIAEFPEWSTHIYRPSQPLVVNGTLYITINSGGYGWLLAYDAAGKTNCTTAMPAVCTPLWRASVVSSGGVNIAGNTLFTADEYTQQLKAFDAAGVTGCLGTPKVCTPLWTAPVESQSSPAIAHGRVLVATAAGTPAVLAFDVAGNTNCGGAPKQCQPVSTTILPGHSRGSVSVSGGVGYVQTSSPAHLVAFDTQRRDCPDSAPCSPLWSGSLPGDSGSTPAVAAGVVYASTVYDMYAFDSAGVRNCDAEAFLCAPLWRTYAWSGSFASASPMVANGLVFIGPNAYDTVPDGCLVMYGVPACHPLWQRPAYAYEEPTVTVVDGRVYGYRTTIYQVTG